MLPIKEKDVTIPWGTGFGWGKRKPKRNYEEQRWQISLSAWLHSIGVKHHASPNGERRTARSGAKLKALGMLPGFP